MDTPPPLTVPFSEALRVWVRVAALSFGGPAGQIAVMHRILVEEKQWISDARFLHALNYCMLLPGPEAQQLAIYIGWLLHRALGGVVAGTLFVLPGFLSILVLSVLYAEFQDTTIIPALFFGLKAAVIAIVAEAVVRIGKRVLKNRAMYAIAVAAFVAIFFFSLPFPLIVLGAGVIGFAGGRFRPDLFAVIKGHGATGAAESDVVYPVLHEVRPTWKRTAGVLVVWLALWSLPFLLIGARFGTASIFFTQSWFFSKTACVTFGGAYAVLAYIAQQAVENFGWMTSREMIDGLGMAETTPGPLIQVVQFVGFLGAYRNPELLSPLAAGVLGSIITTWVTYVPCFLWIFLGAPYIESLRAKVGLQAALSAITAAVVGVILNLSLWFSFHALFAEVREHHWAGLRLLVPAPSTLNLPAAVLTVLALLSLFYFRLGLVKTLLISVAAGIPLYVLSLE